MSTIKLFCFPYGGGSAAIYYDWKQYLNKKIELHPIELAARGRRMNESNYGSLDEGVEDVFNIIKNDIINNPYAFFGHSLGSMFAFELYYKIKKENLSSPIHIFFAGRGAPHRAWHNEKNFYKLPEDIFRTEVLKLGGLPKEILEEPELLDMIFILLREDYKIAETYAFTEKDAPLDSDITILSALNDEASREDMEAWKLHTRKKCEIHYFEGGHFFLREKTEKVVNIINDKLTSINI